MSGLRARLAAALRDRLGVPSMRGALRRLRGFGVRPRHIIDVGAHDGGFAALALDTWPDAAVACIEPLPDAAARLRTRFAGRPVTVHEAVAGARSGEPVTLARAGTASSVLPEHGGPVGEPLALATTRLDDLRAQGALPVECGLLKLDVQGYELAVLQGATTVLENTRVVVAELNLLDLHVGVPLMHEVQAWLAARGFVAWDLAGLVRRPLDGALWQVDLVFVRADDPLRADKRWGP